MISRQASTLETSAADYVVHLYNQHVERHLTFHHYELAQKAALLAADLAAYVTLSETDAESLIVAAWFLPTGYLETSSSIATSTTAFAEAFCIENKVPSAQAKSILLALELILEEGHPETPLQQQLHDVWTAARFGQGFRNRQWLLQAEWAHQQLSISPSDSAIQCRQLVENAKFYTPYGKSAWAPILRSHLSQWAKSGERSLSTTPFASLENRKGSTSPIQTYFRTTYRNHIQLSAIADNKAHIMISVNAILISVIISILSYRSIAETKPMLMLPAIIFVISGLLSLVFAVLAARPQVTQKIQADTDDATASKYISFFGNFSQLTSARFEQLLDQALSNYPLLYQNMAIDLYHLGKVLDKKYRLLTVSYNVFLAGFIATVLTFLVAIFV